ncbi:MarR family winged helix-turn-helix transcriptional regulator [Streptomyces hoynatensis]|uniref:MarR family transcriptional regulator n=1 Tax=Streptomyces hoynatensis TaxID=1141874 RepID=A0A3A9ZGH4_9ACTN|nr:MarR family winged helix-turn-helix transcriptional regulator [Streptomyces hoynatensis]RKN47165.1 MarR family transcriptional regulator [Streptomyces hoynatensis]
MPESPPSLTALTTYLLSRTGKAARGRLGERLAPRGMLLWHMAVLAALADFGPHPQRRLAERLAIHVSDMARIVEELGGAGWVDRERDPADRRRVVVSLTAAGRELLGELTDEARAVQEEVLAPLSPRERDTLHALLLRVHDGLWPR